MANVLSEAIRNSNLDEVRSCLSRSPGLLEVPDDAGELPLETALALPIDKAEPIVRSLLDNGADLRACGSTTLPIIEDVMLAAQYENDLAPLDLLLRLGLDVNAPLPPQNEGVVPLMRAAFSSSEMVRLLLDHHADVNLQDARGWTPLMFVCALDQTSGAMSAEDHRSIVESLLVSGADRTLRTSSGERAVDILLASSFDELLRESIFRDYFAD